MSNSSSASSLTSKPTLPALLAVQKPTIQVFERLFLILDTLAANHEPVSLKTIAERTGLHPSTAHRILSDLMLAGYIDRPSSGSYQLGMRFLELGNIVKSRLDIRQVALPHMQALHNKIGQLVSLSLRQGDEIVYVERAYSERSGMQVVRAIGGRAPLHLTSVGKLFLSQDGNEAVSKYVARTGLSGNTTNSIRTLQDLIKELNTVRKTGIAHDNEELERGVRCMAMGIYDDQSKLIAGLSISAASELMTQDWAASLEECANTISQQLGYKKTEA